MKIHKINLKSFGLFKNHCLEFDPDKKIHLIFGQNEAGKSTLCKAFEVLLFGSKKKLDFLQNEIRKTFFLDGIIENDDGSFHHLIRDGSKQDNKITKNLWSGFSEFQQSTYKTLFSLNQEVIQLGAKDLFENIKKFDVTLFNTLGGKTGLFKLLSSLDKQLDEIFKPKGKIPRLNKKIQSFSSLLSEQKKLELRVEEWEESNQKIKEIESCIKEILSKIKDIDKKKHETEIAYQTFDQLKELKDLQKAHKTISMEHVISHEKLQIYKKLDQDITQITEKLDDKKNKSGILKAQIAKLKIDKDLINSKNELIQLKEDLPPYLELKKKLKVIEDELYKTKSEFRILNTNLQKKLNHSLSEDNWIKIRPKLSKFYNRFTKTNERKIQLLEVVNQELKKINLEINQKYENLKNFTLVEKELKLDFGRAFLNRIDETVKIQKQYLFALKNRENFLKELYKNQIKRNSLDFSLINSLKKYELLKSEKKEKLALLIENWNKSSKNELKTMFDDYKQIVELQDVEVNFFLDNSDRIVSAKQGNNEHLSLMKKIEEVNLLIDSEQKKIFSFFNSIQIFFSDEDLNNLALIEQSLQFLNDLKAFTLLKDQQKSLNQILEQKDVKIEFPHFLQSLVSSLRDAYKDEKKIINEWESFSKELSSSITLLDLSMLIPNLDRFFDLHSKIKQQNIFYSHYSDLIGDFEIKLNKLQYRNTLSKLNLENIEAYLINLSDTENNLKIKEKRTYELNMIQDDIKSYSQKLNQLQKERCSLFNLENMDLIQNFDQLITNSIRFYEVEKKIKELTEKLNFKCCDHSISYYTDLTSSFENTTQIKKLKDEIDLNRNQLEKEKDFYQKKLGELNFIKSQIFSLDKKYHFESKVQNEAAEFVEMANEYLLKRIAKRTLNNVLNDFQKSYQSRVLKLASEYLSMLTNGQFKKVNFNLLTFNQSYISCEKDQGKTLLVNQLSEGTRDQLFLSLKLAMGESYCNKKERVPRIYDDVLVNFDNQRAENAIHLIEKLAEKSQTFFFTHHLHTLEMMQDMICKDQLQVHNLDQQCINFSN